MSSDGGEEAANGGDDCVHVQVNVIAERVPLSLKVRVDSKRSELKHTCQSTRPAAWLVFVSQHWSSRSPCSRCGTAFRRTPEGLWGDMSNRMIRLQCVEHLL